MLSESEGCSQHLELQDPTKGLPVSPCSRITLSDLPCVLCAIDAFPFLPLALVQVSGRGLLAWIPSSWRRSCRRCLSSRPLPPLEPLWPRGTKGPSLSQAQPPPAPAPSPAQDSPALRLSARRDTARSVSDTT